jgi:hypothetical protein
MFILKKAMKFLFLLEQIRTYVAKYSELWSLYDYRVHPHVPSLTTPPPSPHNRVKTSMLKFSIAVAFFACALFKEY